MDRVIWGFVLLGFMASVGGCVAGIVKLQRYYEGLMEAAYASCTDTIEDRNDRAQEIVDFLLAELDAAHARARGGPASGPPVPSDVRSVPAGRDHRD